MMLWEDLEVVLVNSYDSFELFVCERDDVVVVELQELVDEMEIFFFLGSISFNMFEVRLEMVEGEFLD